MSTPAQSRNGYRVAAAVGVAFIVAPLVMQMWARAPKGAEMMNDFKPFMKPAVIESFQGYMTTINESWDEIDSNPKVLSDGKKLARVESFREEWPAIYEQMGSQMLDVMADQTDNFEAISSLPPFSIFPFAFTGLGAAILGISLTALYSIRKRGTATWQRPALIVLGAALAIGPVAVGMPPKASLGQEMMGSMGGLMTQARFADMQSSFLVLAETEGQLRLDVAAELGNATFTRRLPETAEMLQIWPSMSAEMAPMMGAMVDNLDNFAALKAMPPFDLMPWFFIGPGVLLVLLALRSGPPRAERSPALSTLEVQPRKEG